jgi:hypothetical protein
MFIEGVLCVKCNGEGRLVVAEPEMKPRMSENGKLVVVLAVAIGLLVVCALAILM